MTKKQENTLRMWQLYVSWAKQRGSEPTVRGFVWWKITDYGFYSPDPCFPPNKNTSVIKSYGVRVYVV